MDVLSKFTAYSFLVRSTADRLNASINRKQALSCPNRKSTKALSKEISFLEREISFYSFVVDLLEDFRNKGYFYDDKEVI